MLGMALGIVVGIAFGLLLASNDRMKEAFDPYVMGLYSLPRIALAPLFILWFGIGLLSKVMMAFSFVVFIFLLNTIQGLREVDRDHIDLLRSMRAPRAYIARRVQFPAMLPWLFSALCWANCSAPTAVSAGMSNMPAAASTRPASSPD
jgi:NitT/TauT family transport system permease protein